MQREILFRFETEEDNILFEYVKCLIIKKTKNYRGSSIYIRI